MTSPDASPSLSLRERLFQRVLDGIDYRAADVDDAAALAFLFEKAFNESGYPSRGIRYSVPKATAWIANVVLHGSVPHLVAECCGELVGAISYSLDDTFCVEPVAVMHMLYVKDEYKRSAMGRALVGLVTEMAKEDGAVAFHAPIAAQVREQSLVNLLVHGGFEPIGTIMGRAL